MHGELKGKWKFQDPFGKLKEFHFKPFIIYSSSFKTPKKQSFPICHSQA